MKTKNYIDPEILASHCEDYVINNIIDTLRDQIYELYPKYTNDNPNYEDEIVNQAFGYLITNLYKQETNNYDGKN